MNISPIGKLNLKTLFPFPLDNFQEEAIAHLDAGKSVIVTAPTGSGKTVIAEYAIYSALSREKRVFYTTPLKAISNQKFRDFQEKFGKTEDNGLFKEIGLVTGDIVINPDAPIVVMTTEIFRNMLYGTPIGEVGTSLDNVETVILDECHYIGDQGRGTVWEESIIYCPTHIQLVSLSATIGNPEELRDWINKVRSSHFSTGEISYCELVNSDFRPVPLKFFFSNKKGLFNLFNSKENGINPTFKKSALINRRGRFNKIDCPNIKMVVQQLYKQKFLPAIYVIFSRRGCEQAIKELTYLNLTSLEESKKIILYLLDFLIFYHEELQEKLLYFTQKEHEQGYNKILAFLQNQENSAEDLGNFLINNPLFKDRILRFLEENSQVVRSGHIEPLTRGVAAHHAGILPGWKELVERLFELGLIKVIFATSTLAAGINMPAKSTVISALKKRGDNGLNLLTPSEFLQISGRAGRRGIDKIGYVVTVQTPFEGAKVAYKLANSAPENLRSWFTPSYGMVLNLLQKHTIEEAKYLLELSFAEYLAQLQLIPEEEAIASYQKEIEKLDLELAEINLKSLESYEKLNQKIKSENKILTLFKRKLKEQRKRDIFPFLEDLEKGKIIDIQGRYKKRKYSTKAIFMDKIPGSGKGYYLLCLGKDNYWYIASSNNVFDINDGSIPIETLEELTTPPLENIHLGKWLKGDSSSENISKLISEYEVQIERKNDDILEQEKNIELLEKQFKAHPLQEVENLSYLLKTNKKRWKLKQKLKQLKKRHEKLKSDSSYYWEEFLALVEILREFEALDEFTPTALGEASAAIRGENELWLGLALMSHRLDFLEPHHLASAITALVTEPPRFDTWNNYPSSPEVLEALGLIKSTDYPYNSQPGLSELRRRLYQVQHKHDVTMPVWLERDLMGLTEAWCLGVDWNELCENTTLDEGDLVRVLRRTVDVLWQIPQVPGVSNNLIKNAKEAIAKMKRFPI